MIFQIVGLANQVDRLSLSMKQIVSGIVTIISAHSKHFELDVAAALGVDHLWRNRNVHPARCGRHPAGDR